MLVCPDSSERKAIRMLLRKFYTKSSFVPTTAEKDSKKIITKINCLFYYNTSINYRISCYIAMRLIYASFKLLCLCSQPFPFSY